MINKQIIALLSLSALVTQLTKAQITSSNLWGQKNNITTAVPFVSINSNAQSMGSGSVGVVVPDIYSQNGLDQNPAMLSRGKKIVGFQLLNYVPWLRKLASGMNLYETGYYQSIGNNNALGFSTRYFTLGNITFTDNNGNVIRNFSPNEFMISLKYAHNFSEHFSMGTGLKYIHSNLTGGLSVEGADSRAAQAIAGDLGFDFRKNLIKTDKFKLHWNVGIAFLNIGNKISYTDGANKNFLPQTMKLGTLFSIKWNIKNNNYVACDFSYQADKLLVPTPPRYARDTAGNIISDANGYVIESGYDPKVSAIRGVFQSFYDAPGGFNEEVREIIHQMGTEARFIVADNRVLAALRAGYFNENVTKGNRKFTTVGVGLGFAGFRLDYAKLFPLENGHPLENTFILSLGARFNIGDGNFFRFKE